MSRSRPLTAHEIRTARLPTIGLRKGYDPGAVRALLQRLAEETASRDAAISELTSRLHRAEVEAYARRHGTLPASPTANLDDLVAEIDLKVQAQRWADEIIATAQHAGAQIVEYGRRQAGELVTRAHADAADVADAYQAHANGDQRPDRQELARLLGLVQWAQAQLAGLHEQIRVADLTVGRELRAIVDRLRPALEAGVTAGASVESDGAPAP